MVQAKLYQVRFLGVHNIKTLFLKLKACQWLFKNLRNYINMPCMGPEPSESVSDNSETTQLLSHECRTISKNFREKIFLVLRSRFLPIWEVFDFGPFFIDLRKKWSFWLQTPLKNFLGVRYTCSRYLQCPPTSGLSNAPTLVIIRHTETKWCKKNKKRAPEAPFEYYFSIFCFQHFHQHLQM